LLLFVNVCCWFLDFEPLVLKTRKGEGGTSLRLEEHQYTIDFLLYLV
jgi:hypothetical protein